MSFDESFNIELTDVRLVSALQGSLPRLLHDSSSATVTVPEEAASSEVTSGFIYSPVFYFVHIINHKVVLGQLSFHVNFQ